MKGSNSRFNPLRAVLLGLTILVALGVTGCQVDVGGQVLPSPYYLSDDVQYFPPGTEFPLAGEAAAMQQYRQEQAMQR